MEKDRQPTRVIPGLHAPTAAKPVTRLRTSTGSGQLILLRPLFEKTLRALSERSAGWRESAAIWAGTVVADEWVAENVYFHHQLCDDRAGALSLELSETAKLQL